MKALNGFKSLNTSMSHARIFIVEDETIVAATLEKRLQVMGYTVAEMASSGEEALHKIAHSQANLVLMDIHLQGDMDGIETAEQIQAQYEIPLVYLTASSDDESLHRARVTNPFGYIIKPFSDRELRVTIEIALYKHETEKKLREHQQWLAATLKSIADAVISTDNAGNITFMNPVAERLTGWNMPESSKEMIRFKILDPQAQAQESENSSFVERSAQIIIDRRDDPVLITKTGQQIPVEYTVSPIKDRKEVVSGAVTVIKDITERKHAEKERRQLEEQLRQSQKLEALGILAGGIAHDFNNILGTMLGYTELLLTQNAEGSPGREFLEHIYQAGERAADLVQQILTFSHAQEQRLQSLPLNLLAQEALKMIRAIIPANIKIISHIQAEPAPILGDPTQIHQILINLCTNASHAMRDSKGILEISLEEVPYDVVYTVMPELPKNRYVRLQVHDTGCGMPPEIQEHMFEPFFTTKSIGEGTGLGLSVVHGIVKSHKGAINVESTPGLGTTFQIFFPMTTQRSEDLSTREKSQFSGKGKESILLVEDEPPLVSLYTTALTELGYRVTTAQDGQEALDLFQVDPQHFDLIFTDQTMPNMTGAQLCQEVFRLRPEMPVILTTGYSDAISEHEAARMGIRQFLRKPVKLSTLIRSLQEVFQQK